MSEKSTYIITKIKEEQAKLNECSYHYEKLNIYNTIIELRKLDTTSDQSIYIYSDIKKFFYHYIQSHDETSFNYYEFNEAKIERLIKALSNNEQISLLRYFQIKLRENGFEKGEDWIEKLIKRRKISEAKKLSAIKDFFILIKELSTYNFWCIIISIFFVYLLYSILLLPAFDSRFICFSPEYKNYSESFVSNHFLNTIMSFFSIDTDFKSNPINLIGVLIELFIKIVVFVLILNYLLEELKNKIRI